MHGLQDLLTEKVVLLVQLVKKEDLVSTLIFLKSEK
jgi:hypothetical protein